MLNRRYVEPSSSARSILFILFVFGIGAFLGTSSSHAQSPRVSTGFSIGLVGQGDRLIPSLHVAYARPLASVVDVQGQTRFSHLSTPNHSYPLNRGRLTYLDASVSLNAHPVNIGRHRLSFEVGPSIRGRWEKDTIAARQRTRDGVVVEEELLQERRSSVDTGARIKTMYSIRITQSLRAELFMEGYNYNEGTGIFFFGVQTAFSL
jgi:hypothetical protein